MASQHVVAGQLLLVAGQCQRLQGSDEPARGLQVEGDHAIGGRAHVQLIERLGHQGRGAEIGRPVGVAEEQHLRAHGLFEVGGRQRMIDVGIVDRCSCP
jgi:hypothetical protein